MRKVEKLSACASEQEREEQTIHYRTPRLLGMAAPDESWRRTIRQGLINVGWRGCDTDRDNAHVDVVAFICFDLSCDVLTAPEWLVEVSNLLLQCFSVFFELFLASVLLDDRHPTRDR